MFAICGSGFGLYGYLPALIASGRKVVLPRSYAQRVHGRPELAPLEKHIAWAADIDEALAASTGVIIALPPQQQTAMLERCLALGNIKDFLLEKPLAATPDEATASFAKLEQAKKRFEIGYSFLHTSWLDTLTPALHANDQISIEWRFMAHHFTNNVPTWKRHHSQGGGVLRFYGIHLLSVLAYWGYDTVQSSSLHERAADETETWDCIAAGPGLPPCRLRVDSRSPSPKFSVTTASGKSLVDIPEPFALEKPNAPFDERVPILLKLLRQFDSNEPELHGVYNLTNYLWHAAEKKTRNSAG